jgi:flagellar biosynthetic protein FliR
LTGLEYALGEAQLAGFLVAVARTAGFVLVAPPFSTRSVPGRARTGIALGLALPLMAYTVPAAPPLDSTALLLSMGAQVVMGAILGFLVLIAVATVQAVGDLVDLVGGFQMAVGLDPMQLVQTSVMGRLTQFTATALLFVTDGHLVVLTGLARSVQAMPTWRLDVGEVADALTRHFADLVAGAVEVAAPVLAVMLVADVALGLLTRAAPALNAFSLGFPLKILLTLIVMGLLVARLPQLVTDVVGDAAQTGIRLSGARGG